ncbi:MAG: hypothetical protein AAGI88_24555 [Pseudomonadota bacterium]
MFKLFFPFALVVVGFVSQKSQAQEVGRVEQIEFNTQPYYFHLQPGEATTQVYIWGSVKLPGVYEVSASTDLGMLLSLAGGPADQRPVTLPGRRTTQIQHFRIRGDVRDIIYEAELEEMLLETSQYPQLRDGDIVYVKSEEVRGFSWRDLVAVLGATAAVVIAVERVLAN